MDYKFTFVKSNQPKGLLLDGSCGICQENLSVKFLHKVQNCFLIMLIAAAYRISTI